LISPLHAVVMAAGEGRRMRPLTERWPKPILPIDGRPVIATLLRDLAGAGIREATVVTGHLAEQVEALLGDGSALGISVRYARQPEALGSADAVRRALAAGAQAPLLVAAADTKFERGALARVSAEWLASGAPAGLAVRRGGGEGRTPVRVEQGRVVEIGGERGELTAAPLWFFAESVLARLEEVPGPPYELAAAIQTSVEVAALESGPTRDLTHPEDVVLENFPYLWRSV
jgi:UDP-N-acetylglucosamine diphosphorylase / glucose-1-phosphate thymidylyltransferase / UDP-N-acetylgalactosamine diphosphorylase / glucosamine-1-phosphate N-acetyltransferase / galactosamine-1-phosphate N-acetyltransferase